MNAQSIFLSLALLFGFITSLSAQRFNSYRADQSFNKAVYLELGGNGILYSLNYDMRLQRGRQDGIGFKVGIGGLSVNADTDSGSGNAGYLAVPATFNYLLGRKRHALEMGVGATFFYVSAEGDFGDNGEFVDGHGAALLPHYNFGYRYQALNDGFTFRLTYTPFIGVSPFVGISFGFNFK
ncbi:MAG: hypothetical protein AAF828_02240 [Bacteroidota bacterium]